MPGKYGGHPAVAHHYRHSGEGPSNIKRRRHTGPCQTGSTYDFIATNFLWLFLEGVCREAQKVGQEFER